MRRRWTFWHWVTLAGFVLLIIFLLFPVGQLLFKSFVAKDGSFTLKHYAAFLTKKYYRNALLNSLWVCAASTFFATAIGVPMAFVLTRYHLPLKGLFRILIILSLLSPPFIGTYSWIVLLGRAGLITKALAAIGITMPTIYGPGGIVLIFTLHFFPYVYLFTAAALQGIDRSLEEVAENLGRSGWAKLRTVTLPLILPSISAGALLAFMSALADFGTPMLIGEGYKLLPIVAYDEFMAEIGGNPGLAGALSTGLVIVSTLALFLQRWIISRKNYTMSALRPPEVKRLPLGARIGAMLFCSVVVLVAILPQIVVVISSFMKTKGPIFLKEFGFTNYEAVFRTVPAAVLNTFRLSATAIVIMVLAGLLLAYVITRRRSAATATLDALLMVPYVLPGTVIGIALITSFNKGPVILTGTGIILVIAYVIRKISYTVRSASAVLQSIEPSIEEASINLGVAPVKSFFKVTAPLMFTGVAAGAVLSWVTTINELSSTIVLYHAGTMTMPVAVYSQVISDNFGTAAALSSILTVVTVVSLALFQRMAGKDSGLLL
ncbi:MAG TPA: iron ABC transporter permease [Symbiobacteriaceae bacterium]|nr:iron ABC transporter permease [Symbiobacteriaceae bacterium]